MTHCLSYDWMSSSLVWLCVSAVSLVVIIILCFDNGMIALLTLISQSSVESLSTRSDYNATQLSAVAGWHHYVKKGKNGLV